MSPQSDVTSTIARACMCSHRGGVVVTCDGRVVTHCLFACAERGIAIRFVTSDDDRVIVIRGGLNTEFVSGKIGISVSGASETGTEPCATWLKHYETMDVVHTRAPTMIRYGVPDATEVAP